MLSPQATPSSAARIGLFGGSFNPPHLAHLALARLALTQLRLDEVLWLPAGQPWQKAGVELAKAPHRLAMVAALIEAEPGMRLDARECERPGPSFTLDTVQALAAERPGTEWFLILGQDQCERLPSWHRPERLLPMVQLAVAARSGQPVALPARLCGLARAVHDLHLPRQDISSSEARDRCAAGQPVSPLVGDAVTRYIEQHALYLGSHRVAPGH